MNRSINIGSFVKYAIASIAGAAVFGLTSCSVSNDEPVDSVSVSSFDSTIENLRAELDSRRDAGVPVPVPADGGGGYTHEQHKQNAKTIYEAGMLYELTGNADYKEFAAEILSDYAALYPSLELHPKRKENHPPGRLFWQGLNESWWLVYVAQGYEAIRDDLDKNAPRAMCVTKPLKVVLTNYPEDKFEDLSVAGSPNKEGLPDRTLPFGKEVYIEQEDFREEANKKFKRLVIGKRVRLRGAYVIEADEAIKNDAGEITEVRARIIEGTLGKNPEDGVKPKGVIQWVAAHKHARFTVNMYDRLFIAESPGASSDNFLDDVNPNSLTVVENCLGEIGLEDAEVGQGYQFERIGYFCRDSRASELVFNQTISLKDSFNKA